MKIKKNFSQMIATSTSKLLLHHATDSLRLCTCFFGETKKTENITLKNIEQCLNKLER